MIRLQIGTAAAINIQTVPENQQKPSREMFCLHLIPGVNGSKAETLCADGVPCPTMMEMTRTGVVHEEDAQAMTTIACTTTDGRRRAHFRAAELPSSCREQGGRGVAENWDVGTQSRKRSKEPTLDPPRHGRSRTRSKAKTGGGSS